MPVAHFSLYRPQCFPSHCSECYSLPGLLELIIVGTEMIANEAALNLLAASLFPDSPCLHTHGEVLFKSSVPNSSAESYVLTGILTSLPFLATLVPREKKTQQIKPAHFTPSMMLHPVTARGKVV